MLFNFPGGILKLPIWGDPADGNCFDDEVYWEVRKVFLQNRTDSFEFFSVKGIMNLEIGGQIVGVHSQVPEDEDDDIPASRHPDMNHVRNMADV